MCFLMNVAHKNFSDKDSKPLTGCVQNNVFPCPEEIIFIVSIPHSILYAKVILYLYF